MEIGAALELNQKQTVKLAPAQMQSIEILQMNSLELQEKIKEELLENPVLEVDHALEQKDRESVEYSDYLESSEKDGDSYDDSDRWDGDWQETARATSGDYRGQGAADFEKYMHAEKTLHEHLINQLMGVRCSDNIREAAEIVIYSIDSSGYLESDEQELARIHRLDAENVTRALEIVRHFDPQGIGYPTLQECLESQIPENYVLYGQTCSVIRTMLPEVARGDIQRIAKNVGVTQKQASEICSVIRKLEPKPGMRFSDGAAIQYVIPDIAVEIEKGRAEIYMYGSQPQLRINEYYQNMYETSPEGEVKDYLKERISSASQLIENIERRNRTIISVTRSILKHQKHFLRPGNKILLPLTMQDIADDLGIHVSTVSRAVSGKYLLLAGGTYSLKFFFSTDVNGSSREEIIGAIKELVADEDRTKPLSDQKITEILTARGFDVSRRTVAKYRDAEGIPPKSLRKRQ